MELTPRFRMQHKDNTLAVLENRVNCKWQATLPANPHGANITIIMGTKHSPKWDPYRTYIVPIKNQYGYHIEPITD